MNDKRAIVPSRAKGRYAVGDGRAEIVSPALDIDWQKVIDALMPMSGQAQKAMLEFSKALLLHYQSTVDVLTDWFNDPDVQRVLQAVGFDEKKAARERSREDVKRKRREMMKRKGRR